jgi:hypothetical protein
VADESFKHAGDKERSDVGTQDLTGSQFLTFPTSSENLVGVFFTDRDTSFMGW